MAVGRCDVSPNAVERLTEARRPRPGDYQGDPAGAERLRLDKLREAGWEEPVPLDRPELAAFPVEVLPEALRRFVESVSRAMQTPPDLAAMLCLSAIATLAGGRVEVEPRPGWREVLALWSLVVLPSGERKSPVRALVAEPLEALERQAAEAARDGIAEAKATVEVAEQRAKAAATAAVKPGPNQAKCEAEARDLRARADRLRVPVEPRLLTGDVTPERLASLLAEHGRLGMLNAEGGFFGTVGGRYASGQANLDALLQAHSGDPITVDRQNGYRLHVPRPVLTLGLAVQPDVLRELAGRPEFRGRGLLARFLFSLPTSTVGLRTPDAPPVAPGVRQAWAVLLGGLAGLPVPGDEGPRVLTLGAEGRELFNRFEQEIEPRLHPEQGDLAAAGVADWAAKLLGATARVAALLHLAEHGPTSPPTISHDTITGAVTIAEHAISHALAAFDVMGARTDLEPARRLLRALTGSGKGTFSERDAHRLVDRQAHLGKIDAVRGALATLSEYGWARPQDGEAADRPKGGRPPSPLWELHPQLLRERGHNRHNPGPGSVLSVPSPFSEAS